MDVKYNNVFNKYFEDKKINAYVGSVSTSDSYVTYRIVLNDITKLNKFNNAMLNELRLLTGANVSLNIGSDIEITIANNEYKAKDSSNMNLYLGRKVNGEEMRISFKNNPHWLVGGSTGSGKSVFLNNIITQLLANYSDDVEFAFVDLKQVEFYKYNNLKMNVTGVANTIDDARNLLNNVVDLMNKRYEAYKNSGCLNIDEFNAQGGADRYLIVVIDELAELILQDRKIKNPIQRLLQLGRASGIYVICATQRPSNDILPGALKVNFTTRICFKVGNMYDSKTILNSKGAELLAGNGDCLILKNGEFTPVRFQATRPINNDYLVSVNSEHITPKTGFNVVNNVRQYVTPQRTKKVKNVANVMAQIAKFLGYVSVSAVALVVSFMFAVLGVTKRVIIRK